MVYGNTPVNSKSTGSKAKLYDACKEILAIAAGYKK
jgi:hypothetical protein